MPSIRLLKTAHGQKEGADGGQAWEEGLVITPVTNQGPLQSTCMPSHSQVAHLSLTYCHFPGSPRGRQDSLMHEYTWRHFC